MKISLVALVASCAVAGAALAMADLPPSTPPDRIATDIPPSTPPDRVTADLPPSTPPDRA